MKNFKTAFVLFLSTLASLSNWADAGLPEREDLDPYWKGYFAAVDHAVSENFWVNLITLREARQAKDPYISQLEEMGYVFKGKDKRPAPFYDSIKWVFDGLDRLEKSSILRKADLLQPAKAYQVEDREVFIPIGQPIPKGSLELSLLKPNVFVRMLSEGYFPMGEPIRAHTNQTLAEHDLAHMAGFLSSPMYMKAVRQAFNRVGEKLETNPRVGAALAHFDSLYSLRLYYMIEVFTVIRDGKRADLQRALERPLDQPTSFSQIQSFLLAKREKPAELAKYLYGVYDLFPSAVNPVGGESRDILNRTRKFERGNQFGSFYSKHSNLGSKFDGSSIYSLYLNGRAALGSKLSTHHDYEEAIKEIHAPFIATLIGTSQLSISEWVDQAVEEVPNPDSKLYQYLCRSGMWNRQHVIYWAYCDDRYDMVLEADMMN